MPSFEPSPGSSVGPILPRVLPLVVAAGLLLVSPSRAEAQEKARGFAVERWYPSAPGGGWLVLDELDMHGGLGGAVSLVVGYSRKPLRLADGARHLAVVSDQAVTALGFAATYERWRFSLSTMSPLLTRGESGVVQGRTFIAPSVDPGKNPDTLSDVRLGMDVRLFGDAKDALRLGLGAQLFVPNGHRREYDTDDTVRAMVRALLAGESHRFAYAAHLGVHVRPLDDAPIPGSPRGSELLFGAAWGTRAAVGTRGHVIVIGPEIYGATAFDAFLQKTTTALEGMLTGRIEGTADDGAQIRLKIGVGAGLNPQFGAPEWRALLGIELFNHSTDTDGDGVTDSQDACRDIPGVKTGFAPTNGCPVGVDPPTQEPE